MAECNCQAGLKAGQRWCKETEFLQSPQKPPLHFCSRTVTLFVLMNPLIYILTLGFILHCLLLFLLSGQLRGWHLKNLSFWGNKTSVCAVIMYWAHCLGWFTFLHCPLVYLFCFVLPASWCWQERPYQNLYQGQVYYTQQNPCESELDLARLH